MCGFLIIFDRTGAQSLDHHALLDTIQHRGPDACGIALFDQDGNERDSAQCQAHVFLGHRRLSIIDLDPRSNQPFSSTDGRHVMIYNGEVYNYLELRAELEAAGIQFRTSGDTEVVLEALRHWGANALNRFEGMFTLALYDRTNGKVLIGRDQLGIKPLFQTEWAHGTAFASEVWPLLMLPGVSAKPAPERIVPYLTSGGIAHDGGSYFSHIQRFPAAHYLEVEVGQPVVSEPKRYWKLVATHDGPKGQEAIEEFRARFLENVRLHLRADVSLGVALSGGIDSSALLGAIRYLEPDIPVRTFSFLPQTKKHSEEKWIDICADALSAPNYKTRPVANDLLDDLPELLRAQGEPFGTTSIYAQHRVMRLAAENGVKVMLDGQGADEMLGGYAHHIGIRVLSLALSGKIGAATGLVRRGGNWAAQSKRAILRDIARFGTPLGLQNQIRRRAVAYPPYDWILPELATAAKFPASSAGKCGGNMFLKNNLANATTYYGLPDLLRFEDRNSMHVSIESRVPFLTRQFVEFCAGLPEDSLIDSQGRTKAVLRDAMRGLVPDAILDRRDKIGFRADTDLINGPIAMRFLDEMPTMLLPDGIDWPKLGTALQERLAHNDLNAPWIWRAINLAYWHDMAIRKGLVAKS